MSARARTKTHTTVVTRQVYGEAQKFAAVILKIPAGRLASAAQVSKAAAELWKAGKRLPNYPNMRALAQSIPLIHAHITKEIDPSLESDRMLTSAMNTLLALADVPGSAGDKARQALRDIHKRGG